MKADFDQAAVHYDAQFTNTVIGKMQRDLVYGRLSETLSQKPNQSILEINCGTGEDAIWMAKQNHTIIATDISEVMLQVAKNKTALPNLSFRQIDINELSNVFTEQRFDLIFSNFGGLNCLSKSELENFFKNASQLLAQNGQLVLVIMPKNTLWEQLYFLLKGNSATAFRRKKESAVANVNGENVTTYYYNPTVMVHLSEPFFEIKQYKPIGFFVPPSYLESFFRNKPKLISFLNSLEQKIKNRSWLSEYADHYIITAQKK